MSAYAAREVFVSTMSILYSVGKDEGAESESLLEGVRNAKDDNGNLIWTPASWHFNDAVLFAGHAVSVDACGRAARDEFMAAGRSSCSPI